MALTETRNEPIHLEPSGLGSKAAIYVGGTGALALLAWRWLDIFTWPLTLSRELLDGTAIALAGAALLWCYRELERRQVAGKTDASAGPSFARALYEGGVAGTGSMVAYELALTVPHPPEVAPFRALFVASIVLGAAILLAALRSATVAARRPRNEGSTAKGVILPVLIIASYLVSRSLRVEPEYAPAWWEFYLAPPALVTVWYVALRLRHEIERRVA